MKPLLSVNAIFKFLLDFSKQINISTRHTHVDTQTCTLPGFLSGNLEGSITYSCSIEQQDERL